MPATSSPATASTGSGPEAADGSPSTLNLILPEVYLEDGDADARVEQIHATMPEYAQNVLTRAVAGFA